MSDLKDYTEERMAKDSAFAEGLEEGYRKFRAECLGEALRAFRRGRPAGSVFAFWGTPYGNQAAP